MSHTDHMEQRHVGHVERAQHHLTERICPATPVPSQENPVTRLLRTDSSAHKRNQPNNADRFRYRRKSVPAMPIRRKIF